MNSTKFYLVILLIATTISALISITNGLNNDSPKKIYSNTIKANMINDLDEKYGILGLSRYRVGKRDRNRNKQFELFLDDDESDSLGL